MNKDISIPKIGRPFRKADEKNTKEKIFDTAVQLFSNKGYERTSVRELASSIGLTEGAIYRHYVNKEAIFDDIFVYAEKFVFSALPIEQSLGMQQGMSIFRGLLEPLPEIILAEPYVVKIIRIMFLEIHHNERIRNYYQKEYQEKANNMMTALFEKCVEIGSIRQCDTRSLAKVFNCYRSEWAYQHFVIQQDTTFDTNALKKELNEIILFFEDQFLPKQSENTVK